MKESEILKQFNKGAFISIPSNTKLLKILLNDFIKIRKKLGVYFNTIQSYEQAVNWLKKEKIEYNSLFFLSFGKPENKDIENLFVLYDPSDLTELSVVITEIMEHKDIDFLVIDRVGGLETYVKTSTIKKFIQALALYIKKLNKYLIITNSGIQSKELMLFIAQISDYHKE